MGDGSYFDDAPRQSDFLYNDDGSMLDDTSAAATKALENWPLYKQSLAGANYLQETAPLIGKLFDGEATFDDLFNIVDSSLTLAVNCIELIELSLSVSGGLRGDLSGVLGTCVSTLVSMGLTFILESLQPVQDLFGMITGNPGRIRTSKEMWEALATGLAPIGGSLAEQAAKLDEAWQDSGADSARLRLLEGNDILQVTAALANGVGAALEFCATTFEKVQGYVLNRTSDLAGALVSYVPKAFQGPKGWIEIALDFIPMVIRMTMELIQIAMHLTRACLAILGLINGAQAAAENARPFIERMSRAR